MLCFKALFSDACDIKRCYIIASSLHQAMFILYEHVSRDFSKGYLDEHLLRLEFHDVIFG